MKEYPFDVESAIEILTSFVKVCGLGATLIRPLSETNSAQVLFTQNACAGRCPHCKTKTDGDCNLWSNECAKVHLQAASFSDSFGGKYFYQCNEDNIFICSPIISDGGIAAAMVIGPVHIFEIDRDKFCESEYKPFAVRKPEYVQYLSNLLGSCAVSISESSQTEARFLRDLGLNQQSKISTSILQNKHSTMCEYPIMLESNLTKSIVECQRPAAHAALNELLGMLMSSKFIGKGYSLFHRAGEIITVCSRAALEAGVQSDVVFKSLSAYRNELEHAHTNEQICLTLQRYIDQLIYLVGRLKDVSFDDDIYRAIEFVRSNYNQNLSLDYVANEIGFSAPYFSRLFKKKFGVNFNSYVNEVRINASKNGLLATNLPIAEIARLSGYEDPSYFTRVFKKNVGVSPGYFRSHRGQISKEKEHGNL